MSVGGIAGISFLPPGVDGIIETKENVVSYGDLRYANFWKLQQALIDGASRDTGNTAGGGKVTELRAGLLMSFNQVTNKWEPYDGVGAGNTGLQEVSGVLYAAIQTQKDGADQDRFVAAIYLGGLWRAEGLIILGETDPGLTGATLETITRASITDLQVRLSDEHETRPTVA